MLKSFRLDKKQFSKKTENCVPAPKYLNKMFRQLHKKTKFVNKSKRIYFYRNWIKMDTFSDNSRCSSFEALTHDPNLSRLAKQMFQKTNDYLNFEVN